jgi:hypothetical protein
MSARPSDHADSTLVPARSPSVQGHHPASPFQIPWAGWKQILWRTYARINEDRLLAIAAGYFRRSRRWFRFAACSPTPRPSQAICKASR